MKIFFSVGEPSGDLHGANLIRELQRRHDGIQCVGFGGPKMAAAGCDLLEDMTKLAVMWVLQVVLNIHRFWSAYRQAKAYFRTHSPDAVVLIDFPGFNWWIARAARKHNIPVFYYGAPQLWAWAGWRVRKMRRLVDHVLCKLPFEARWYGEHGCNATFVGHPYFDQLKSQTLDQAFIQQYSDPHRPLVAILPGSRTQEVTHNLQWFLRAASIVQRKMPHVRFAIAAFNEKQAEIARQSVAEMRLDMEIFVGRTQELMRVSRCCIACSGSVSLELLHHTKPTVILYWAKWFPVWLAKNFFIKVKYITLVNLLAAETPFLGRGEKYDVALASSRETLFPEFLTSEDRSKEVAGQVMDWLNDDDAIRQRTAELEELRQQIGNSGASAAAAEYILAELECVAIPIQGRQSGIEKRQESGKIPA